MDPTEQNKIRAANIRAVWSALLTPKWDRDLLIALGKALFARRSLKDVDDKLYEQLLPRLVEIVEVLETKFKPPIPESPPVVTEGSPDVTVATGPGPCPTGPTSPKGPTRCTTGPDGPTSTAKPATPKPNHAPAVPPPPTPEPKNSEDMMTDTTSTRKE
jgi:hypothetical protein